MGDDYRSTVQLITELSKLISFDEPILFQIVYDSKLVPAYLVMPTNEQTNIKNARVPEHWKLRAKIGPAKVLIETDAARPQPPNLSRQKLMNRAVVLATDELAHAGRLSFPFILSTADVKDARLVTFTRVPEVTGGFLMVEVSLDFKKIRVYRGH